MRGKISRRTLSEMTAELARSPWRILLPGAAASLDQATQAAEHHAALLQADVRHWREVAEGYRIDAENSRREAEAFRQLARDTELEAQDAEDHARRVHEARTRAKADGVLVELPRCRLAGVRRHAAFPPMGA